uniref:Uncharacterized protein n=1 Tax=Clastoptera arizonana TaxID=38151 RepID=A0A1B6DWX0_9HEMI
MHKQTCQSRPQLKRKRRSSDDCSDEDIENLPVHDEKRHKDETHCFAEDEPCCSYENDGERQPLSELNIACCVTVDNSLNDFLASENEIYSVSDGEDLQSQDCDVAELSDAEYDNLSPGYSGSRRKRTKHVSVSSGFDRSEDDIDDTLGQITPLPDRVLTKEEIQILLPLNRNNPLPPLEWADLPELWGMLCQKDATSMKLRDPNLFMQHPCIESRMRAILLDWISEVCDVYRLHRETYYLTMDFIDRYLSRESNIPKQRLQLIGITCLAIAAKSEEIYPPKMREYAYVTDGACEEEEILKMEITIIQVLDWHLVPVTPLYWLKIFMQLCYQGKAKHDLGFLYPQFSPALYDRVTRLLNLATLDAESLNYAYSILATSCVYLVVSPNLALAVSGLSANDIMRCVKWMSCYWEVLQDEFPEYRKPLGTNLPPGVNKKMMFDESINLQTHNINLSTLETGRAKYLDTMKDNLCLLTPPPSSKKTTKKMSTYT